MYLFFLTVVGCRRRLWCGLCDFRRKPHQFPHLFQAFQSRDGENTHNQRISQNTENAAPFSFSLTVDMFHPLECKFWGNVITSKKKTGWKCQNAFNFKKFIKKHMCSTEVDNLSDKKAYTYILMEKHLQNKFQQNTYVTLTQRIM